MSSGVTALNSCDHCGYLLVGLPETGTCPECGQSYRASKTVTLFGRNCGRRRWVPEEGTGAIYPVLMLVLFGLAFASQGRFGSNEMPAVLYIWAPVGAALLVRQAVILSGTRAKATLGPHGCGQSDMHDVRAGVRAVSRAVIAVGTMSFFAWIGLKRMPRELIAPVFGAGTFLALVIAGLVLLSRRLNSPKTGQAVFEQPTIPWSMLSEPTVRAVDAGRARLIVRHGDKQGKGVFAREAVALEFEATPEQAAGLKSAIKEWRRAAPR